MSRTLYSRPAVVVSMTHMAELMATDVFDADSDARRRSRARDVARARVGGARRRRSMVSEYGIAVAMGF